MSASRAIWRSGKPSIPAAANVTIVRCAKLERSPFATLRHHHEGFDRIDV
jgi:hypothetical protein